uniref:Uncharacterized protein n=1 Tax=Sinocyclocheilus grahami TaxID=75366 RepID=A0A672NB02_SINGR
QVCDGIVGGTCGCIQALPSEGPLSIFLKCVIPFPDINECQSSSSVCGPNSNCTNQLGSYNCLCSDGFTDKYILYEFDNQNVDECLKTPEVCGPNSHCTNSVGSYSCSCLSGFTVTNSREPVIIGMSITINQTFDRSLTDPDSKTYKDLSGQIESTVSILCFIFSYVFFILGYSNILYFVLLDYPNIYILYIKYFHILWAKFHNLIQNFILNFQSFLNTVDIIVSGNVSDTWNKLNKGNNTEDTSIKLLSAIEDISDRLTDEFDIYESSIQLNRTTIKNSINITSALPNSATEIVVPQVPQETTITIIIFSTLDKVLPSQGTNDSRKSDVRINGDVVVVKVNETLNNISFTFDITNQSLGNPQCVFWNFNLSNWDSTGCEVKPYISKGNETGKITCECNHTTSFSILMSPFSIDHEVLDFITYIGIAISMASLIICLIIETIVWKSVRKKDTSYIRHVSIVNIAVSLLIANICFIIGAAIAEQEQPPSVGRCSPVVFFMHFFYLALFFWMLMSALLLFYRTVMVLSQMSRAKMMVIAFIVGYGAPLLIAVITVASTAGPQNYISKKNACWLNWYESEALLAFVIPAFTIVAINLVVLIVVLYKMLRRGVSAATQPDEKHTLVVIARCVAFLTPIFGLTWGFGIGTMVSRDFGIHVVFALLNSLQVLLYNVNFIARLHFVHVISVFLF